MSTNVEKLQSVRTGDGENKCSDLRDTCTLQSTENQTSGLKKPVIAPALSPVPIKMGNSSSINNIVIDGETFDINKIKRLIPELRNELRQNRDIINKFQSNLKDCNVKVAERDAEISKLKAEIDKLKSVLQATQHSRETRPDILSTIREDRFTVLTESRLKKPGVSGESSVSVTPSEKILTYDKNFRSKQAIKDGILGNDFLKHLDPQQVREIVDCMYQEYVSASSFIIKEGGAGQHLYVIDEGELEVTKDNKYLGKIGPGRVFGELAILYNCTRTASVRALTDAKLWVLDRHVFQAIMRKTGQQRHEENVTFLKSVPILSRLSKDKMAKIADVLDLDFYDEGEYIVRQGALGDTFFIINKGEVEVTQKIQEHEKPQVIRKLRRGDFFGERALLSEDRRTANVRALAPGVECLTLDRAAFNILIGEIHDLRERDYGDVERGAQRSSSSSSGPEVYPPSPAKTSLDPSTSNIELEDLEYIATLGMGGFGRVELVQHSLDKSKTFALKCLKKTHIVETRQQEHVFSERKIMMETKSPFIAKLHKTFKNKKFVYMLLEVCLGGELWSLLRDKGSLGEPMAKFCVACVLEAFEYLHCRGIIYRDLKPENLMLDSSGYIKLVDFGFAKKIGFGKKTWTFCGTPEYVAPEIILNKGHDYAADYWSLGILVFELLSGAPPFNAPEPMKIYNIILRGIDVVDFPRKIGRGATNLIKKLCKDSPGERLGYGKNGISDIRKHRWFQGFDWDGLRNKKVIPPIVPRIKGPTDSSNFDKYPKDDTEPEEELSGWDEDF